MSGPGAYCVVQGLDAVHVIRNRDLRGPDKWIAYAAWTQYLVTDPLPTKKAAIEQAKLMIQDKIAGKSPRCLG
jgi:hypothetical protein